MKANRIPDLAPETEPDPERDAAVAARQRYLLERRFKTGVGWFYWLAALSVFNSILYVTGGTLPFFAGLTVTQVFGGYAAAQAGQDVATASQQVRYLTLGFDVVASALFAVVGYFGRKRNLRVIYAGMALYALDGVLAVTQSQLLSVLFHVYVLWSVWRGLRVLKELEGEEGKTPIADPAGAP